MTWSRDEGCGDTAGSDHGGESEFVGDEFVEEGRGGCRDCGGAILSDPFPPQGFA